MYPLSCVHSGVEHPNEIFSLCQVTKDSTVRPAPTSPVKLPTNCAPSGYNTLPPAKLSPPVRQSTPPVPQSAPPVEPVKPLTAPLEEILPLPAGVTIPKISPFGSLGTPLPVLTTPEPTLATPKSAPQAVQSGTKPARQAVTAGTKADATPLSVQNTNQEAGDKQERAKLDPNSVTAKFLASHLDLDNPLARALLAENNVLAQPAARPQPATAKIFAPRTKDMNKGYLTFTDDNTGIRSEYTLSVHFIPQILLNKTKVMVRTKVKSY